MYDNKNYMYDNKNYMPSAKLMEAAIDTASMEELDQLSRLVRMAKKRLGKLTVKSLTVGDAVTWSSGKTRGRYANMTMQGKVVKINTTRVKVDTGSGVWNVPGSMLEVV